MFYFDPLFLLFAIPGLLLGLFAQFLVWIFYSMYSKEQAGSGMSGLQAAELINQNEGFNVKMVTSNGWLNDYFNPLTNTVNLSSDNATSGSIANIAVVAHEFGHVQQKHSSSILFGIRSLMVPAVTFGANFGYFLIIIGLIFSITGLAWVGLAFFSLTAVFALITLPIEIDASFRGMALIKKYRLISDGKLNGARLVLFAAALTYVAGLVQALGQVLYFFMLVNGRRD